MKLQLTNNFCRVDGTEAETVYVIEALSFSFPGAYWVPAYRKGLWDGTKCFYHRGHRTFPSGMLPYVLEVLEESGICPRLVDKRGTIPPPKHVASPSEWAGRLKKQGFPVHPLLTVLQYRAVKSFLSNVLGGLSWSRGLVSYPTGSGKTTISFWILESLQVPSLYVIERQDLLLQSSEVYEKLTGHKPGMLGIGIDEVKPVTFGMLQSLRPRIQDEDRKTLEYLNQVQVVVVDEAHLIADNSYLDVLGAMPNTSIRLGTSGSLLRRTDLGDWYLMGAIGGVVTHLPSKTLRDAGLLSTVKVFLHEVSTPEGRGPYSRHEKEVIVENDYRNELAVLTALRAADAGWKTLLLVKRKVHGEMLRTLFRAHGVSVPFLCYVDPAQLRKAYLNEMRKGDRRIVISSGIFKMGIDVPAIRCLIRLDGGASVIDSLQIAGRGMRRKDELNELYLFDFMDRSSKYFLRHSKARLKVYEAEAYEIETINDVEDVTFAQIQPTQLHDGETPLSQKRRKRKASQRGR